MNNIPKIRMRLAQRSAFAVLLALTLVLLLARSSESARPMQRPVSNSAGQILQSYLWATESDTDQHRGIDFPNFLGTDVYAVADGVVVDLEEGIDNTIYDPDEPFGNFVLIRHLSALQHYDATEGTTAYTYTIYAHLSKGSVIPNDGDSVTAGSHIADIDDTGNSSGHHLHFQVVLNDSIDLEHIELEPYNTLESENRSRNPELWLKPYPGTGTAIGKVSNWSGNPVSNLLVCGLHKNPQYYYSSSRTYSFDWANPDDILHENFGTTDVLPETYNNLYAVNLGSDCGGTHVYNLGKHTFVQDRVTYVGLYPSWLPVVRPVNALWDADIFIRNHASELFDNLSYTSFVTVTSHDKILGQESRNSNPNGTAVVSNDPSNSFSAIVVPNRDSSVVIMSRWQGQPAGYTGVVAANINDNVFISPGWEQAGSTLYVPLVKDKWANRSSQVYITNVGAQNTYVNVTYYNRDGVAFPGQQNLLLKPNTRVELNPTSFLPDNNYYSARISNITGYNQPLAAVVLEQGKDATRPFDWPAMYNAFSSGNTTLYAPMVKKNYAGNTTGITLHNTSSSTANFQAIYYDMNGNQVCISPPWPCQPVVITDIISANAPYVLYNPSEIPDGFLGSVRVISTNGQPLVGQMSEGNGTGGLRLMSNLALGGSNTIHLPLWYDNYTVGGSWMSGVNVQNVGTGATTITATWYYQDGAFALERTALLVNSKDTHNFYETSLIGFIGSVVITSEDQPIVAVSNVRNWAGAVGTDSVMAFNGSNR